jgi:PAS domain S-box-containing protein
VNEATQWALYGAQASEAAIVVHGPDTAIRWCNDKAAQILGLTKNGLDGRLATDPSFRLFDADGVDLPVERYPVVLAIRRRAPIRDYIVGTTHSGSDRPTWGLVSAEPRFDDEGELLAVVVTFVDITELREAQQALQESEERYSAAVSGTSDGLWDVDLRRETAYYSPRFEALLGLPEGSLPTQPHAWLDFVHPEDLDEVRMALEDHLERHVPYDVQFRVRHRTGRWLHVRSRGRAARDGNGMPIRMSGTTTDITSQVEAEAERREVQRRLEVAARIESLSVLAGGVAHDFNNLLVGILGAADTARRLLRGQEPVRELLDIIAAAGTRAAELTRQLMAYAGRGSVSSEVVDVSTLVAELAKLVRGSLPSQARLELALIPQLPGVKVDATLLRQGVLNLIVNAGQAVAANAGCITLATRTETLTEADLDRVYQQSAEPGRFVVVTVEDDGIGMDATTQERVFEPFFTTKPEGHGLGLAALIGLVQSHQGFIRLRSAPGTGSRFDVGLPALDRPAPAVPASVEDDAPLGRGRWAVVVEDQPLVRQVVQVMLEREGFRVQALEGRTGLLSTLTDREPALLVLDLTLGWSSGALVLQQVREAYPRLPVLLYSGHIDAASILEREGDRPTAFLPKPFGMDALREALLQILDQAPAVDDISQI